MIRIINSQDKTKTKLVSKEVYKESLINSFADGIIGHFNDADFFFTDIENGYLKYVAEAIDKAKFENLVNELIEEGYAPNLDALNLEEQIQYLYQNKLVDNYDLYELIDTNKLADLMMENKCGWIFSIDDTDNSFYTDLADLDLTEVTHERKEYGIGDSINIGNITGIIEDYDDKYFYVRDSNANTVKIKKIKDGTWELPFTKEKAEKLYDLVCTNKYDSCDDKMKILYGLYGSDSLFDALYNYSKETTEFNPNTVKRYVKKVLNEYKENPENFFVKLEPEAKVILEKIINDSYPDEINQTNDSKDYTSIQNMTSRLKTIVKETSIFQSDKKFGAAEFKELLEENGFEVEYVENKSGTWQKDDYNEYFKNYDIKLENGQHIYFRVIADDNFDTKEIICYLNGKNW